MQLSNLMSSTEGAGLLCATSTVPKDVISVWLRNNYGSNLKGK